MFLSPPCLCAPVPFFPPLGMVPPPVAIPFHSNMGLSHSIYYFHPVPYPVPVPATPSPLHSHQGPWPAHHLPQPDPPPASPPPTQHLYSANQSFATAPPSPPLHSMPPAPAPIAGAAEQPSTPQPHCTLEVPAEPASPTSLGPEPRDGDSNAETEPATPLVPPFEEDDSLSQASLSLQTTDKDNATLHSLIADLQQSLHLLTAKVEDMEHTIMIQQAELVSGWRKPKAPAAILACSPSNKGRKAKDAPKEGFFGLKLSNRNINTERAKPGASSTVKKPLTRRLSSGLSKGQAQDKPLFRSSPHSFGKANSYSI